MYAGADKVRWKGYILHPPVLNMDWKSLCEAGCAKFCKFVCYDFTCM